MTKLSDITGHLVTLGLAGVVACSGAKPTPDASALNDQPKAAPQAEATPVTPEQYHAQGQADLDKAIEQLRNVSVFFEFDSATLTRDAQDKLTNVEAEYLAGQVPGVGEPGVPRNRPEKRNGYELRVTDLREPGGK